MSTPINVRIDHKTMPKFESRIHVYDEGYVGSWLDFGSEQLPSGKIYDPAISISVSENVEWCRNVAAALLAHADLLDKALADALDLRTEAAHPGDTPTDRFVHARAL